MVADQPTFSDVSDELYTWMSDCDLAGYNSNNFDIPLLCEEFGRCEMVRPASDTHLVDVLQIERSVNSHRLSDTYRRYT
jgi:DNA polymerase-3 subunit epsilon